MYEYEATFIRAKDGDTVVVLIDQGFGNTTKQSIRFLLVNTPEKEQPGYEEATKFTEEWFAKNPKFIIQTHRTKSTNTAYDGWGRYFGMIYNLDRTECFNQLLLDKGLAKKYTRKTTGS